MTCLHCHQPLVGLSKRRRYHPPCRQMLRRQLWKAYRQRQKYGLAPPRVRREETDDISAADIERLFVQNLAAIRYQRKVGLTG